MSSVLFVTRKFPPAVGGMERLAADVWATLQAAGDGRHVLVAHPGSQRTLPFFLVRAIIAVAGRAGRDADILCGDVVLYLLLRPWLRLFRRRHAVMAMGKDVVWSPRWYQWAVRRSLPHAPLVLAISEATAAEVLAVGVAPDRVRVVRLGVEPPALAPDRASARRAARALAQASDGDILLLTLGRLVRRKGVAWFAEHVLPGLPEHVVYVVAGDGEDAARIREAVRRSGRSDRVRLLGVVDEETREALMRGADVFVQPNIAVPGDMEGFGLVAVEAAMRGSLVVAASLEGLRDAVVDGETGFLVPSRDPERWIAILTELAAHAPTLEAIAGRFARNCRETYDRESMGRLLAAHLAAPSTAV